jgi:predicted nuclease of predicted toxin-antitoxin system
MSSKKHSSSPPEDLTFFIDRCLGKEPLASSLRALDWNIELHDDHFPQDAPDTLWLSEAGQRGWIVLSKDQRIRFRPLEREMLVESRCRVFILTAGSLSSRQIADIFVRAAPKIERMARQQPPPFQAYVSAMGKVTICGRTRRPRRSAP